MHPPALPRPHRIGWFIAVGSAAATVHLATMAALVRWGGWSPAVANVWAGWRPF